METEDVLKLREAREELVRVGFVKSDPSFRGTNSSKASTLTNPFPGERA